ncbi:hypothetical protein [Streptomyces nigrescens]|uniref:hypothetical protein n=1 Tax=Streptomyces nigrescens TaxID=1920 RepID=UPI00348C8314
MDQHPVATAYDEQDGCTPLDLYAQTLPASRGLRRRRGQLSVATSGGGHTGRYRLLTTLTDPSARLATPVTGRGR